MSVSQHGVTFDGRIDGVLRPACRRTMPLIYAERIGPELFMSMLSKSRIF